VYFARSTSARRDIQAIATATPTTIEITNSSSVGFYFKRDAARQSQLVKPRRLHLIPRPGASPAPETGAITIEKTDQRLVYNITQSISRNNLLDRTAWVYARAVDGRTLYVNTTEEEKTITYAAASAGSSAAFRTQA
jgi:hypothetical protein